MQEQFVTIKELYRNKEEYIGKTVKVAGWIRTSRASKNFGFVELNDGSFFKNMQIVLSDEKLENFKEVTKLPISSSILVEGELVSTEGAKQPVEIQAIGAGALNQAIKAIAIARGFVAPSGKNLVCIPAFTDIMIDGEERTAIKLIIEAI